MSFLKEIMKKPWLASESMTAMTNQSVSVHQQSEIRWPEKTALYFFLSVVTVLFLLFTITYLSRSQATDFQALAGETWLPLNDTKQLWINTFYLLVAGGALQLAVFNSTTKRINLLLILLILSSTFTAVFIFGQIAVWQQLSAQGYFIATNPANSFYYLLTGLHGLHLLGGVFALLYVIKRFYNHTEVTVLRASLSLCTTYWHYLFIMWLFLFALLTASTETYRTIALFCGF